MFNCFNFGNKFKEELEPLIDKEPQIIKTMEVKQVVINNSDSTSSLFNSGSDSLSMNSCLDFEDSIKCDSALISKYADGISVGISDIRTGKRNSIESVIINDPVFRYDIIKKIYKENEIYNQREFIKEYTNCLINNSIKDTPKERCLNVLNMFRILYNAIIDQKYVSLNTMKVLQDKYKYCCEQYKSKNDENIFPKKYLLEMEEIVIQVQKLPFGNNM